MRASRRAASEQRRRGAASIARAVAAAVALAGTFAGAIVAAVSLHAATPAFRRAAAAIGNEALAGVFEGRIVVSGVESLSIGASSAVRAKGVTVTDPEGQPVIVAEDVEARIDLARLLSSLVSGGAPVVELSRARVASVEVVLDVDANGAAKIARAFRTRSSRDDAAPAPEAASRRPYVAISSISVGHARIRGDLAYSLDGEADTVGGRLRVEDGFAHVDLDEARVKVDAPRLPGQKVPIEGVAKGALKIELASASLTGDAELEGACGPIPVSAHGRIDRDEVEASIVVARAEPEAIAAAFGDLLLAAPIELRASARGKLPSLAVDARGRLGTSDFTSRGELDLREGHAFKLDAEASHLDARALGAATATDLSGELHAEGALDPGGGAPIVTFRATTSEGTVAAERIPPAIAEGRFDEGKITATLRATEPGIAASGKVTLDLPANVASFDLQARSSSLRALARARGVASGAASARVQGSVDLDARTIKATTTASGEGLGVDAFSAKRLAVSGTLEGPLLAPILDLGFAGVDVAMKAGGAAPLVYPTATGRARIAIAPSPRILEGQIKVGAPGSPDAVVASLGGVRITNGAVEARDVRVTGLGEPLELDVRAGEGQWSVRAKSAGVDVRRAAAMTGIEELTLLPAGTRATVDVDVRQGPGGASGHVDLALRTEPGALAAADVVAEAHAKITRGKLVGDAKIAAGRIGHVEIARAELDVPDRIDARSLRRTTGVVELRGAIDLSEGAAMFAGPRVERASGVASFEGRVERGDPDGLPAARFTVKTEGLDVALVGEDPSRTVEVSGVELLAHLAWDGRTDDAEVALLSWDRHGVVGSASAKAKLPLAGWATGARRLDAGAIAALEVDAIAELPARRVARLPAFLGPPELHGNVGGQLRFTGPIGHPDVVLSGRARGLRSAKLAPDGAFDPLDGTLEARWDGERATITFSLDERRRLRLRKLGAPPAPAPSSENARKAPGHLRGLVLLSDVRMTDLLRGRAPSALPWTASAEVEVEDLPLGALALPNAIAGTLSGRARLRDLNRDASFEANARVDGFAAGGATVQSVDLNVGGRDASLFARASAVDEQSRATFQLASKGLRVKGADVSWDASAPTRIDYSVENGRLALLGPFVRRAVAELDGRVDGAGSVTIDEGAQTFEGGLAVQGGKLYVNALGEEISSLDAIARFERTGTFRIEEATGKMGAGSFRASASGRMKGLEFVGGEATILVPKEAVPLSSEAVTFAEATGEVKVAATMSDDRSALLLTVDVPRANVALPDRGAQSLQSLDPDPTVAIGVRRPDGELDTTAIRRARGGTGRNTIGAESDALTTRIALTLGGGVHLQGRGLDVTLGGRTLVEIADELAVTGRLDLRGGTVEVHGRRFNIDHGTVTFPEGGAPDDPTIIGAAYWDAPDRTRVWVELSGPLKTGKLTLRSEPAYSKDEILSVLLFGRPDPNMATSGGEAADGAGEGTRAKAGKIDEAAGATAVGTGIGLFAGDLNRVLAGIDPDLDVETDTLDGNRTRGKVGHSFFDRRIKLQVGYAAGGTYRDPDTTFLFLNWQFIPKWSVVATAGDKGTSILDVLFQHRY